MAVLFHGKIRNELAQLFQQWNLNSWLMHLQFKKLFGQRDSLSIAKNSKDPMILYCNSQETIAYTKDPNCNSKIKHIDIKYKFV